MSNVTSWHLTFFKVSWVLSNECHYPTSKTAHEAKSSESSHAYPFKVIPGFRCILICRDFWKVELTLPSRLCFVALVINAVAVAGFTSRLPRGERWWRVRVQKQKVSRGSWSSVPDRPDEHVQSRGILRTDPATQLLHLSDVSSQLLSGEAEVLCERFSGVEKISNKAFQKNHCAWLKERQRENQHLFRGSHQKK